MALDTRQVVDGSFGKVYENGVWLMHVYGIEANGEQDFLDVNRSGKRAKGKKPGAIEYTGTIQSYSVGSEFNKRIRESAKDGVPGYFTELIVTIEDPANPELGRQKTRLKGVQFTNIPVINFTHGELVEEELQFVFEDFEDMTI